MVPSKSFEYYAEHDATQSLTTDNAGVVATTPSKNGFFVHRKNTAEFIVYERANDPDEDWIPNVEEDKVGTIWNVKKTYPAAKFHGDPYDWEFWAEWRTKRLIPISCTDEKDWANPGLQTK
jgi:hypothetical protein